MVAQLLVEHEATAHELLHFAAEANDQPSSGQLPNGLIYTKKRNRFCI